MYRKEAKNSIMEVYNPYVKKDKEAQHRKARQATQTGANTPVTENL